MAALAGFRRERSGTVAIAFAIAALPVLLAVGAAVDYSNAIEVRTKLKSAADEGALAAAQNASQTAATRKTLAQNIAIASLGALASQVSAVATETEPASGQYQVTVTASVPTSVMKLAHINTMSTSAVSVAAAVAGQTTTTTTTTSTPASVCILVKSTTASQAFLGNSGAIVKGPNCEVDVASTASPAAMLNSGMNFTVNEFCVAGTNVTNNGASITNGTTSVLKTGCKVASDPFAGKLPSVTVGSCTVSNQNYSGNVTISPGVYCGSFNFNGTGTVTMNAGLYIFKGATWNLNSGWTLKGSGVTIYFADTSYIQLNGTAQASLTAPTSGTYANILMFEPTGLSTSSFTMNGGSATPDALSGLIYLPSRNLTLNSGASANAAQITLVVNTLIMDSATWTLTPAPNAISSASSTTTTTQTTTTTSQGSTKIIQ